MRRRTWILIAFVFLAFAEALSWVPVQDAALCLMPPAVQGTAPIFCPTFLEGLKAAFLAADHFLENHDKSVIGLFTIILGLSTIGLWVATNKLWHAGETQRALSEDTAERQLRAYISVETGESYRQSRKVRFEFRPVIVNNGSTPARDVTVQVNIGITPLPVPADFDYRLQPGQLGPSSSVTDLGPRQSKFTNAIFHRKATIQELRGLIRVTHLFHVYGNVFYTDVFNKPRVTRFSYLIFAPVKRSQPAVWRATERHNDAD